MSDQRNTMVFYRSFYECVKGLPETDQLKIYNAIFEYSFNFEEMPLEGISKSVWILIKPLIDAATKNFVNGNKPKKNKPKASQLEAKGKPTGSQTEGNKDKDKDDNKDKEKDKEGDIFGTPVKKWWHKATREILKQKVYEHKSYYPIAFLDHFIGYYATETERAEMLLHEQSKFNIESALKNWYADPATKLKYPMPVKNLMTYIE